MDYKDYLDQLVLELEKLWPYNRVINLVFHGHSVPSGYFQTPFVNMLEAYPQQLLKKLKERFPFAVINAIITACGGEHSQSGAQRFNDSVLCHRPDVICIDYGLNDRAIGLKEARKAWTGMIEQALKNDIKLLLFTPTFDTSYYRKDEAWTNLVEHAEQIRELAGYYQVGLVDSFTCYQHYLDKGGKLVDLLSFGNHPNTLGHQLVAEAIYRHFNFPRGQ